jgi:CheY-like chemotaxis protein
LLLTSMGRYGDPEERKRAGIEAYLTKPVRQSALYDALATMMGTPDEEAESSRADGLLLTSHKSREAKARSHVRVLLAEDNTVNQRVAMQMLQRLGYLADLTVNGKEAVEALENVSYAAVLMDVQMPEMDGYEATAEIRRREKGTGHHTPIIAMTANALEGDREKALRAGMDDYVSKPVRAGELEEVLERWTKQEGSKPEVKGPLDESGGDPANHAVDVLDHEVLRGLRELQGEEEPDLLVELVEDFFEDAASRLKELREAVNKGKAAAIERSAHALKGSSGSLGARRMAEICSELQELGATGDITRIPALLECLEGEFERVRPALKTQIAMS